MGTTTTTFSADATNTVIGTLNKGKPTLGHTKVRVDAYDDFGGGTLTFAYSPDGGTTKIGLKASVGGSAISFTGDEGFTWDAPLDNDSAIILYGTLSGSTSPDLKVKVSNPHEV